MRNELAYNIQYEQDSSSLYPETLNGHTFYNGINRTTKDAKRVLSITKEMAIDWFHDEFGYYPEIDIVYNGRLKKCNGRFKRWLNYKGETTHYQIEMSGSQLKHAHIECILKTLKHELIHYHLWVLELPHQDGTHRFESMVSEYELPSNYSSKNKTHPYTYTTDRYVHYVGIDDDYEFKFKKK